MVKPQLLHPGTVGLTEPTCRSYRSKMGCVWGFADQFLPNKMLSRLSSNLQKLFYKTTLLLFSCL